MKSGEGIRKLVVVLIGIGTSFALALLGKLTSEYATVVSVCAGGYAAANAVEWNSRARFSRLGVGSARADEWVG